MSSSLLLRDIQGKIVGYALTDGAQLCIRVSGGGQNAMVAISDGIHEKTISLRCDGVEMRTPWRAECSIVGVCVWAEGCIVASGGEKPPESEPQELTPSKKETTMRKKEEATHVYTVQKECAAPSPRWPPPPCWQTARYFCGDWIEGDDLDEEM